MVGVVIGVMAGARIISSLCSGMFIHRVKTRYGMSIGLIVIGICIIAFGILHYLYQETAIGIIALFLRII